MQDLYYQKDPYTALTQQTLEIPFQRLLLFKSIKGYLTTDHLETPVRKGNVLQHIP